MSNESMGYCEGLCGGLYDHHLVDGLCPKCKKDTRIQSDELCLDEYDGVPLGVEAAFIPAHVFMLTNGINKRMNHD